MDFGGVSRRRLEEAEEKLALVVADDPLVEDVLEGLLAVVENHEERLARIEQRLERL